MLTHQYSDGSGDGSEIDLLAGKLISWTYGPDYLDNIPPFWPDQYAAKVVIKPKD